MSRARSFAFNERPPHPALPRWNDLLAGQAMAAYPLLPRFSKILVLATDKASAAKAQASGAPKARASLLSGMGTR